MFDNLLLNALETIGGFPIGREEGCPTNSAGSSKFHSAHKHNSVISMPINFNLIDELLLFRQTFQVENWNQPPSVFNLGVSRPQFVSAIRFSAGRVVMQIFG